MHGGAQSQRLCFHSSRDWGTHRALVSHDSKFNFFLVSRGAFWDSRGSSRFLGLIPREIFFFLKKISENPNRVEDTSRAIRVSTLK
jgi:hypothetical protein